MCIHVAYKLSKCFKTFAELVEVEGDGDQLQVDATDAPAMRQKKEQQSPRPKVDVPKASVNKNQRSIASFFSKK